jgi:mono/diheme cytochrome c family protein
MRRTALMGLSLVLPLFAGCDSGTEDTRDVSSTRVVMRPHVPVPPGTVPRGTSAQTAALMAPGPPAAPELVRRGRERFMAFCSPCHGASGNGDGVVVSRGFPRPPSYYEERLRHVTPERIVAVITRGIGAMYPYAERVPPEDRWAIAHYLKELQTRGPDPMPEPAAP